MTNEEMGQQWPAIERACRAYCKMLGADADEQGYFSELWSGPRARWELYTSDIVFHMRMNAAIGEAPRPKDGDDMPPWLQDWLAEMLQ